MTTVTISYQNIDYTVNYDNSRLSITGIDYERVKMWVYIGTALEDMVGFPDLETAGHMLCDALRGGTPATVTPVFNDGTLSLVLSVVSYRFSASHTFVFTKVFNPVVESKILAEQIRRCNENVTKLRAELEEARNPWAPIWGIYNSINGFLTCEKQ